MKLYCVGTAKSGTHSIASLFSHYRAAHEPAVQKLLPWYLTGRLEDAERLQVDEHLATCAECRAELETERQWQLLHPGHGAQVDVEEARVRLAMMALAG